MAGFNGKSFLLGIQHLDAASRELFARHGKAVDGRWSLVEQIADEAMLRMVGAEIHVDAHSVERWR